MRNGIAERARNVRYAREAVGKFGLLGTAARYLAYRDGMRRFLDASHPDREIRRYLARHFDRIHSSIECAHSPFQFYLLADLILELDVPGPIVECGVFKGGSSAKFSHIARVTGRELYLCDSFEGLPALQQEDSDLASLFGSGTFSGGLEEVRANIAQYGDIGVCNFVVGFFDSSLAKLDVQPAVVFEDADLVSSARDCLTHLWPRVRDGGYWFTHEAQILDYLVQVFDPDWWHAVLHEPPPILIGGGSGLSAAAPSVAYVRKG